MLKQIVNVVNDTKCPKIYVTGFIGDDDEVDYNSIRLAFDTVKNFPSVECYVNTGGGSMTEGFAIYDHVQMIKKETGIKVKTIAIGMAASMGTVLMCCGDKGSKEATANAMLMFHKPQVGAFGESQALRDMADLADNLELKAIEVYKEHFGVAEDAIKKWMVPGKQTWMTAKQALANKVIDKITNAVSDTPAPGPSASLSDKELWNTVYNKIHLNPKQPMKLPKLTFDKLNLPEDSSDADVTAAIDKLVTDKAAVEAKLQAFESAETDRKTKAANTLVDGAIAAKKITAAEKDTYVKFALNDFDAAKSILDKLTGPALPTNVIKPGEQKTPEAADRSAWTFDDWRKKDGKGLAAMRATDAEKYDALVKAHTEAVRGKINIKG